MPSILNEENKAALIANCKILGLDSITDLPADPKARKLLQTRIRKAYHAKARIAHTDKGGEKGAIQAVIEAHTTLCEIFEKLSSSAFESQATPAAGSASAAAVVPFSGAGGVSPETPMDRFSAATGLSPHEVHAAGLSEENVNQHWFQLATVMLFCEASPSDLIKLLEVNKLHELFELCHPIMEAYQAEGEIEDLETQESALKITFRQKMLEIDFTNRGWSAFGPLAQLEGTGIKPDQVVLLSPSQSDALGSAIGAVKKLLERGAHLEDIAVLDAKTIEYFSEIHALNTLCTSDYYPEKASLAKIASLEASQRKSFLYGSYLLPQLFKAGANWDELTARDYDFASIKYLLDCKFGEINTFADIKQLFEDGHALIAQRGLWVSSLLNAGFSIESIKTLSEDDLSYVLKNTSKVIDASFDLDNQDFSQCIEAAKQPAAHAKSAEVFAEKQRKGHLRILKNLEPSKGFLDYPWVIEHAEHIPYLIQEGVTWDDISALDSMPYQRGEILTRSAGIAALLRKYPAGIISFPEVCRLNRGFLTKILPLNRFIGSQEHLEPQMRKFEKFLDQPNLNIQVFLELTHQDDALFILDNLDAILTFSQETEIQVTTMITALGSYDKTDAIGSLAYILGADAKNALVKSPIFVGKQFKVFRQYSGYNGTQPKDLQWALLYCVGKLRRGNAEDRMKQRESLLGIPDAVWAHYDYDPSNAEDFLALNQAHKQATISLVEAGLFPSDVIPLTKGSENHLLVEHHATFSPLITAMKRGAFLELAMGHLTQIQALLSHGVAVDLILSLSLRDRATWDRILSHLEVVLQICEQDPTKVAAPLSLENGPADKEAHDALVVSASASHDSRHPLFDAFFKADDHLIETMLQGEGANTCALKTLYQKVDRSFVGFFDVNEKEKSLRQLELMAFFKGRDLDLSAWDQNTINEYFDSTEYALSILSMMNLVEVDSPVEHSSLRNVVATLNSTREHMPSEHDEALMFGHFVRIAYALKQTSQSLLLATSSAGDADSKQALAAQSSASLLDQRLVECVWAMHNATRVLSLELSTVSSPEPVNFVLRIQGLVLAGVPLMQIIALPFDQRDLLLTRYDTFKALIHVVSGSFFVTSGLGYLSQIDSLLAQGVSIDTMAALSKQPAWWSYIFEQLNQIKSLCSESAAEEQTQLVLMLNHLSRLDATEGLALMQRTLAEDNQQNIADLKLIYNTVARGFSDFFADPGRAQSALNLIAFLRERGVTVDQTKSDDSNLLAWDQETLEAWLDSPQEVLCVLEQINWGQRRKAPANESTSADAGASGGGAAGTASALVVVNSDNTEFSKLADQLNTTQQKVLAGIVKLKPSSREKAATIAKCLEGADLLVLKAAIKMAHAAKDTPATESIKSLKGATEASSALVVKSPSAGLQESKALATDLGEHLTRALAENPALGLRADGLSMFGASNTVKAFKEGIEQAGRLEQQGFQQSPKSPSSSFWGSSQKTGIPAEEVPSTPNSSAIVVKSDL